MGNSLGMKNKSSGNITVYNNRPSLLFKMNYRKKSNLGRPKATFTNQFVEAYQRWKTGNITAVTAIAIELSNREKSIFFELPPVTHYVR